MLGPSPIQSLSWIFWGSMPLTYPVFFPGFPKLAPPLYGLHIVSYCTTLTVLLCHLTFTALSKGISPLPFILPHNPSPMIYGKGLVVLWEDWKVGLFGTSSQDGSVGRHSSPLSTTTSILKLNYRTTITQNCQKLS